VGVALVCDAGCFFLSVVLAGIGSVLELGLLLTVFKAAAFLVYAQQLQAGCNCVLN
jgi:hypothetical protein